MKPLVLLAVLAILWLPEAFSPSEPGAMELELEEPFIYADLVVEGGIERIERISVPIDDYLPGVIGPDIDMAIMEFRVDSVFIGYLSQKRIEIVANILTYVSAYHYDFVEGERYILSLHLPAKGKLFEVGRYLVRSDSDKYFIEGDRWVQGGKINRLAEGELRELYNILDKVKHDRSVAHMTKEAELIVRGVVLDSWETHEQTEEGIRKDIIRVKFAIRSIAKGITADSTITISAIDQGFYRPFWRTRVPDMHTGEEWILFLKSAAEPGYYPFAGVNGLFMVEGQELLRNNKNRVHIGLSAGQLEQEVNRIIEGGE